MKIAFVSDVAYPYTKGGMEALEYEYARELAKKNDVYFFSLQFEGMKKEFIKDGIHYIGVAKASASELYNKKGRRSIALARRFAKSLAPAIREYSFDLVIASAFPFLHLNALKRSIACPLVLDVVEVWPLSQWRSYLGFIRGTFAYFYAKRAIGGADLYIANSSTTKAMLEAYGIEPSKIETFSPAMPNARQLKPMNLERKPIVMYAGRLIPEKRLDKWLDAIEATHKLYPKARGLIIGAGKFFDDVKNEIERRGLDYVEIRKPFRSREELYKVLGSASAMLNMSEREGLSVISIESVALGTPVVLPSYTPIPEEVRRMCNVVPEAEIPRLLARILRSRDKSKFVKNRDMLNNFSAERIPDFFGKLFRRLEVVAMQSRDYSDVSIVLPTIEEVAAFGIVDKIRETMPGAEIIVVDKSSEGYRKRLRKKNVKLIEQQTRGVENAWMEGFSAAKGKILATIDADGTYDVNDLVKAINVVKDGRDDLVIGNRLHSKARPNLMARHLSFGNKSISKIYSLLDGIEIHDGLSGLFAMRREVFEAMKDVKAYRAGALFFVLEASKAGYKRIVEIPISYYERPEGTRSKLAKSKLLYGLGVAGHIIRNARDYSPLLVFGVMGAVLILAGLAIGAMVMASYLHTGMLTEVGRALIASMLVMLGFLSIIVGLILDLILQIARKLEKRK